MRKFLQYPTRGRAGRAILVVIIALVALSSPLPSSQVAASEAVWSMWSPGVVMNDERNIEKFATAQVQPPYPLAAQKYRIQGTVTVHVAANKDGKVSSAEFVRGHTVFRSVSLDAAKQWLFDPANANIEGTINFTFSLK